MRYLPLLIFLLTTSSGFGQTSVNPEDLLPDVVVFRQEYQACATELNDLERTPKGTYLRQQQPFSGCARHHAPPNKQYRVSYITAGTVEKEVTYYYSGATHAVFNFKGGRPHGYHTMYYPDGTKYIEEFFVEGRPDGYHRRWHNNGQLARERRFNGGGIRHEFQFDREGKSLPRSEWK